MRPMQDPNPTWGFPKWHPLSFFHRRRKGRGKRERKGGPNPLFPSPNSASYHRGPRHPLWAGVLPSHGPYGPYILPGGSGNPSGTPINTRYILEHFRCPNTIVIYINLYLSTISRLLIMSVISSGTPNNIRSPNHITHIILNRHRTLSVRTLRVRELCRHDQDTSPVNNQ